MAAAELMPRLRVVAAKWPLEDPPPSWLCNADGEAAVAERRRAIRIVTEEEARSCDGN